MLKRDETPASWIRIGRVAPAAYLASLALAVVAGCAPRDDVIRSTASSQPAVVAASQPAVVYDTTAAKPIQPRDALERLALQRGADLRLVDRWTDPRTPVPALDRRPLPRTPAAARIDANTPLLGDTDPFPDEPALTPKPATINFAISRSTYRTREPEEVLSAVQPFIDLTQNQVNVRAAPTLVNSAEETYYGLLDGKQQLVVGHVFEYLLVQNWFESAPDNGVAPLAWARPARPRSTDLDRALPGPEGSSIELVVAADSKFRSPTDLKGARLALPAIHIHAPGTFLTRLLADAGQPPDQPFFASVALRRYAKDALIDVLKGRADAACVDQGTIAALIRFYGVGSRLRTIAVSPRYHFDTLFTSLNNLATHRTEIELTQRQLTTLGKDPEGQEVLFFFDIDRWENYRAADFDVARAAFPDFVRFMKETPVDLKPLLDPAAPVDRRTYDRGGDE